MCGRRSWQILHAIFMQARANNTHYLPCCLKECPLLQEKPLHVIGKNWKSYRNYEQGTNWKEFNWQSMHDREMIRYWSHRLCDRDIWGDISTHGITLQVLAPGFWKILLVPVIVCHVCLIIRWCHLSNKRILQNDNSLMPSYQYLYTVMKCWCWHSSCQTRHLR